MMRFLGFSFFLLGLSVVVLGLTMTYSVNQMAWFGGAEGSMDHDDDRGDSQDDDDDSNDTASLSEQGLSVSPHAQGISGIEIETLSALAFRSEMKAFGRVVDVEPMLALRLRYDKARLAGSKALLENIEIHAALTWGGILAAELLDGNSQFLESVAQGREVLVQVTLPLGETLEKSGEEKSGDALLYRNGEEDRPIVAEYISPAPRVDPAIQGETHFYRAATNQLRTGMAVDVAVILDGEPLSGVFIPGTAIIWRDGQAWIYTKMADQNFKRVVLPTDYKTVNGWFVARPDWAGMKVVVMGAQTLLSEEFRDHLGDDDDD